MLGYDELKLLFASEAQTEGDSDNDEHDSNKFQELGKEESLEEKFQKTLVKPLQPLNKQTLNIHKLRGHFSANFDPPPPHVDKFSFFAVKNPVNTPLEVDNWLTPPQVSK